MRFKNYTKRFFITSFTMLFIIFSFTIIVDPYDVTGYNLLNIKYKFVRDNRLQKIGHIKKLDKIDNIIFGSSRSERLNPKTVDKILGGFTYTFGVGGANIEDTLGLLLYLQKENKLPSNAILCIDFSSFRKDLPTPDGFYKIPEINFLNKNSKISKNYGAKLFSLEAFRSAVKTFKRYTNNKKPDSYVDDNGFLTRKDIFPSGDMNEIIKVANEYYDFGYKKGDLEFSEKRFEYLKQIINISKQNNINLYIMLTPVHEYLYNMITNNKKLFGKMNYIKDRLSLIYPYYDAMTLNIHTKDKSNFADAVHTNTIMGDKLLKELLKKKEL